MKPQITENEENIFFFFGGGGGGEIAQESVVTSRSLSMSSFIFVPQEDYLKGLRNELK